MSRRATVSRSQAFSRFLPGAIETVDGETIEIDKHDIAGAMLDPSTRDYLNEQLRGAIASWQLRDASLTAYIANPNSPAYEFVTSVRLFGKTLQLVECKQCKSVRDVTRIADRAIPVRCDRANCNGRVRVVPFVEIHGCGSTRALRIEPCARHGLDFMILDRSANALWRCGHCDASTRVFAGYCGTNCYFRLLNAADAAQSPRRSRVPVGSSAVFQSQSIDILNPPHGDLGDLFRDFRDVAPLLFVGNYFGQFKIDFSNLARLNKTLLDLDAPQPEATGSAKLEEKLAMLNITGAQLDELRNLIKTTSQSSNASSEISKIKLAINAVRERFPKSGPTESGFPATRQLIDLQLAENLRGAESLSLLAARLVEKGGICALRGAELEHTIASFPDFAIEELSLVPDFPIVSCAYGFTRGYGSRMGKVQVLRSFPKRPSVFGGSINRTPFYIIPGRTEAVVVRLQPEKLVSTLRRNGFEIDPAIADQREPARQWIFDQFQSIDKSPAGFAVEAMVHSYSHRFLEQVSVESCFSAVSLSEMLMPSAAAFILYVNQRSEFNIGGLGAFVEQRLNRALVATAGASTCMFDPICETKDGGACNGCLYLPEVTCRQFNQALSRSMLHGGELSGELSVALGRDQFDGLFSVDSNSAR